MNNGVLCSKSVFVKIGILLFSLTICNDRIVKPDFPTAKFFETFSVYFHPESHTSLRRLITIRPIS